LKKDIVKGHLGKGHLGVGLSGLSRRDLLAGRRKVGI